MTCRQVIEQVNAAGTFIKKGDDDHTNSAVLSLCSATAGLTGLVEKIINSAVFLTERPDKENPTGITLEELLVEGQTVNSLEALQALHGVNQIITVELSLPKKDLEEIMSLAIAVHGKLYNNIVRAVSITLLSGTEAHKDHCFKFGKAGL